MTVLYVIFGLLVLAILVISVIALQRPDTFRVSRGTLIAAPVEQIFPLINDLHAFNQWNPFNQKDPAMTGSYSGPSSGPGAHYDFQSRKAGSGFFEITESVPSSRVCMRLLMTAPIKADNVVTFTLVPQGSGTEATWSMEGQSPLLSRFMGVIFDLDKMVGTDFAAGLASLKAMAEHGS